MHVSLHCWACVLTHIYMCPYSKVNVSLQVPSSSAVTTTGPVNEAAATPNADVPPEDVPPEDVPPEELSKTVCMCPYANTHASLR